jgi:hypothetical protein
MVRKDFVMDKTLTLLRVRLGLETAESWWSQGEDSTRLVREWTGSQPEHPE